MKKKLLNFRPAEFILVVLILFSGINLGFSSGSFVLKLKDIGFTVFSTVQKGVSAVTGSVSGAFTAIKEFSTLREQYGILSKKVAEYEYIQKSNTELLRENEYLKEQLDFTRNSEYKTIAAQIIARDPDALYSAITINKGSRHGIKKGMCVVAIQNGNLGLVGKIVTVGYLTSMIMPLYDQNCNISARIQNTREIGIVTGNGTQENFLDLQYIKKRYISELNVGDIIVTSGENENYRKDVPIGRITRIKEIDYDNSLDILIDPIVDFDRLESVIAIDLKEPAAAVREENHD